jgi:curved DNA-binding protein CbpA
MAPDEPNRDLYEVLGVTSSASPPEVTSAYRRLVRDLHPDSREGPGETDAARLGEVLSAYEVLRDPARRASYDARRDRRPAAEPSVRGVTIPIRRVERASHSPDAMPLLRAGPAWFDPQPPPGPSPAYQTGRAVPTDLLGVVEAFFLRWW